MHVRLITFGYIISALSMMCLIAPGLAAQSLTNTLPYMVSLRHFTLEQGLPNRTVITIGQDKQGFAWLGMLDNAYRFDGKQFSPLPATANQPRQKAFNPAIDMIRTDRQGNMWLASSVVSGNRNQYILKPGAIQPQLFEQAFGHADPLRTDLIYDHIQSPTNTFQYVRTQSGSIWRHKGEGKFQKLFSHPRLAESFLYRFTAYETARQTVLVTFPVGPTAMKQFDELVELDSLGHVLRQHSLPFPASPIWKDTDGNIYLHRLPTDGPSIAQGGNPLGGFLYQLRPNGALIPMPIELPRNPFPAHYSFVDLKCSYDSRHNLFWVYGYHLLLAWHPQQGVVFDLSVNDFPIATVQKINQMLVDRTGAVWLSTANGILLLTLEPNRFQRYLHVSDARSSINRQAIRGMLSVGDQLWVNAHESQVVNLQTGRSQFILNNTKVKGEPVLNQLSVDRDEDGTIWSVERRLLRIDPRTFQVTPFPVNVDNITMTIWPDGRHHLWLGHTQGLSLFNIQTGKNQNFTRYNHFGELAKNQINGFFPDRKVGDIWVAASSGLYVLDTLRGITARYSSADGGKAHLPFDHITFVHPDPDQPGVYWLATRGGGLIRWDRRTGSYQQFTQKQGLSDNTLYCIYEDKHQRLWLPSNYGLMCFHRKTHQLQIFHTKDGIADEEFNLLAHHRAPDGRLFLGGLNGITAFYPDQIQAEKSVLTPLQITQYQKLNIESGQMVSHLSEFQEANQIHLSASDRLFSLSFALLDYRHLGKSRLWYRIQNWQEKWVMQESPELRINGLPVGEYTLQVRAQTANGDWASPILSIPITVDKPFYLRIWFLLLVAGGVFALFRWRNRQLIADKIRLEAEVGRRTAQIEADKAIIEQQAADLRANATLKSRFFANVSHEFRTPLTLMMGPLHYLTQRITDASIRQLLGAMERNAQQLLALVNDLLNLSRLDINQLTLDEQPTDLAQVIQQTVAAFMPQAQYAGINLVILGCDVPFPLLLDTQKLETVVRNLIANALRYTLSGGRIQVRLQQIDGEAHIEVSDTGSGIHPADLPHIFERYFQSSQPDKPLQGGMGIGLALCQEYCQLWEGSITASSQLGKGSTFIVRYPIRTLDGIMKPLPALRVNEPTTAFTATVSTLAVSSTGPSPSTQITILVVDDNTDMQLYIQAVLSPYYSLRMANNGREALDLLKSLSKVELPDLIISDIMMPEVDGLTLVNALRNSELLAYIPVVLLTARADLDSRLQALELGVADYMTKPFYEAELLARIQNLLRRAEEQSTWQQAEETDAIPEEAPMEWIQTIQHIIQQNIANEFFSVTLLAELTHLSTRQLNRRTKLATGLSPSQLIQEIRLQNAYDLFEKQPQLQVKSVAYQVGYQKTSYFIQLYRERFGINPGEQLRQPDRELSQIY